MHAPKGAWLRLVGKESRELLASRPWWLLVAAAGPLVGVSFIAAVRSFAEVSAGAGLGCGAVCSPLTGIWAPTFGAYEIIAIFLLPFVVIRQFSGDRLSGALLLETQGGIGPGPRVAAKLLVLTGGWLVAGIPAAIAVALWKSYGGPVSTPELLAVVTGHFLNAGLTMAVAMAAATIAEHPSTAAIVTLGFTVGTWIVEFISAVQGGVWSRIAAVTPVALVAQFQHGLIEVKTVLVALTLTLAGAAIAATWLRLGHSIKRRATTSALLAIGAAVLVAASTFVHGSLDTSEGRLNSFGEAEEEALERLTTPLTIDAHLAPIDPRRLELERRPFAKLRRVMPSATIRYTARTSSGLYEAQDPGYGEIWYAMGDRRVMNRVTTDEGVVESIFEVAGVPPPNETDAPFMGHPLEAQPRWAAATFYGVWPVLVLTAGALVWRKQG